MKRRLFALALLACCRCRSEAAHFEEQPPDDQVWLTQEQMTKANIRIEEASERDIPQVINAGGKVAFDDLRVTHVFSPVTGRVTRVLAQPGQRMQKGSPLVAILSPDVGTAFSDLVKGQADLTAAESDFHRQKLLSDEGAATKRDFETAKDTYERAKAEYDRARQRVLMLKSGSLDNVTQEYTLRSYIEGEVIMRSVNPGVEVVGQYSGGSSNELFTIGDIKEVWVFADVSDVDLPKLKMGDDAAIQVLAYPGRVFHGKVDYISGSVDPALRTARVRCVLPNQNEELKPEMFARVSLAQPPKHKLAVPKDTVVRINESSFVFVADGTRPDGKMIFKRRQVTTGDEQAGLVPVVDGLKAGDRVVTEGAVSRDQPNDEVWPTPKQVEEAGITIAIVHEVDVEDAISVGGRLTFDDLRMSHIFSPVNGRITKVLAQPGQHVEKGTPLVALSSPDVGQFFADVVKAQADLTAAEHEYSRQKEMFRAGVGAQRDLEGAEGNWKKAKAELDRAQQKTQLLKAGTVDAVTSEYVLRSPIEGEVISRNANPGLELQGQYSTGSNVVELFTIGDTDRLWVLGDVYEMDLPHIAEGDLVTVNVGAYPDRTFKGVVDWVADVLDPQLHTAKVRCVIDNKDHLLKPEMYEAVSIAVPGKQVLAIPRDGLLRVEGETVVFVATGQARPHGSVVFKRRRVVANEEKTGSLVPIISGLKSGETVAVENAIFLLGML
ncbi:MAG TPA: efflux RND transporter periplasmic adaptor subunit [Myxococcaceae bacterium]|nr:efflux RND transporter periplasmic adaptor subunit [Myxococcaceae bacterium]